MIPYGNKKEAEDVFFDKVGDEVPIINSRDLPNTWKNKKVIRCENIDTLVVKTIIFNKNKEYYFVVEDSCPNCNWVSVRKYEEEPSYIPGIEVIFKYSKLNGEYYRIVKPFEYWNLYVDGRELVDNTHELVVDYVVCGNHIEEEYDMEMTKEEIAALLKSAENKRKKEELKFNTEYICQLISKDRYIFDIRSWPNGINKNEFNRLWDHNFKLPEYIFWNSNYFWNAGHFAYVVEFAKRKQNADKERIWEAIEKNREAQIKRNAEGWKNNFEKEIKWAKCEKDPEILEHIKINALKSWKLYNDCLRELGLPEEPVPNISKIIK